MISKNTWQLLKEEYEEFPQSKCSNANDVQILSAEKELNVIFSQSYRYFLKFHEVSGVGSLNFYTLTRAQDSSLIGWSVIEVTKWFKEEQQWPDIGDWYIVANNGSGDPIGIKPNGEVWISYHDSGFEQEKLADNFEEFLYKLLTETLWV